MFMTLYKWELKKIWKRRITKITLAITVGITIFMGVADIVSSYSIDGETVPAAVYLERCREYSRSISGRVIDDTLLNDMRTSIDQSGKYYNDLYDYTYQVFSGDQELAYNTNAESLYQERSDIIHELWDLQCLTDGEKAYWEQKESAITPYKWQYAEGYKMIIASESTINIMLLFLLAVCLPAVFSDEHIRRTDQLILSSRFGKKKLYGAKLSAGVTFGLLSAVLFYTIFIVLTAFIHGMDGFGACMQMFQPECSWTLTMGQTVLFNIVLMLILSVLYSVLAMFLAESLKNGIASMALLIGSALITLFFQVPYSMELLSKLYSLVPFSMSMRSLTVNYQLFHIFGQYFSSWQLMPFLYSLIAMILGWLGGKVYQRYQVTGR